MAITESLSAFEGAAPAAAAPLEVKPARLLAGTMASTDLGKTRKFFEELLGFECVQYGPDRMLARDRFAKAIMEAGGDDFCVIDIRKVDEITTPQRQLHHWGVSVDSIEEVERIHAEVKSRREEFGLRKFQPLTEVHGARNFYFTDHDTNWWEIERRSDQLDNFAFFARGDVTPETDRPRWEWPDLPASPVRARTVITDRSIVGNGELTHGTCELSGGPNARHFREEVLGLRTVAHRHPTRAHMVAGRGDFVIVSIELPRLKEQEPANRWLAAFDTAEEVEAVRDRALAHKDEFQIREIGPLVQGDHGLSCLVEEADGNWWEAVHCKPSHFQEIFARGDA